MKLFFCLVFLSLVFGAYASCNVLSLSGGGSHGAIQAGILHNLLVNYNKDYTHFSGISAGSLNSYWLSSSVNNETLLEKSTELHNLWNTIKNDDVYKWNSILSIFDEKALLDSTPLQNTLTNLVHNRTITSSVAIGVVSLLDSDLYIFYKDDIKSDPVPYLLSSSAIPLAFPPITINQQVFVDGGTHSDFLTDISFCNKNTPVQLDIILTYSTIDDVSFNVANNYKLFDIATRTFHVANFIYFNNFISDKETIKTMCNNNVNITIYQPSVVTDISILDFTQGDTLWNLGYNNFAITNLC